MTNTITNHANSNDVNSHAFESNSSNINELQIPSNAANHSNFDMKNSVGEGLSGFNSLKSISEAIVPISDVIWNHVIHVTSDDLAIGGAHEYITSLAVEVCSYYSNSENRDQYILPLITIDEDCKYQVMILVSYFPSIERGDELTSNFIKLHNSFNEVDGTFNVRCYGDTLTNQISIDEAEAFIANQLTQYDHYLIPACHSIHYKNFTSLTEFGRQE